MHKLYGTAVQKFVVIRNRQEVQHQQGMSEIKFCWIPGFLCVLGPLETGSPGVEAPPVSTVTL